MKNNSRPIAAAIPIAGSATRPTSSPIAPPSFTVPSIGSHDRGTCTSAEFASTNPAGIRSATPTAAVMTAVNNVTTTHAGVIRGLRRIPSGGSLHWSPLQGAFVGCGRLLDGFRLGKVTMKTIEDLAQRFDRDRRHLKSVAFHLLGSVADAEDAVQSAWLKASRVSYESVCATSYSADSRVFVHHTCGIL